MTIFIEKGELIVGNQSPKLRCPPIYPETGASWILKELYQLPKRQADPVIIKRKQKNIKKMFNFLARKVFGCHAFKVNF